MRSWTIATGVFLLVLAPWAKAQTAAATGLEPLAKAFRQTPTPATRAAVERFAQAHPKDADGALARLTLGNGDPTAIERLAGLRPQLPLIPDYFDWILASTLATGKRPAEAAQAAARVLDVPETPLAARAAALALKSALEAEDRALFERLWPKAGTFLAPAPKAFYAAISAEQAGQVADARKLFAEVLVQYPKAPEAADAATHLALNALTPRERLDRTARLLEAGDATLAMSELTALLPRLEGPEADVARARLGICEYRLRRPTAVATLAGLRVTHPEADADRLLYLVLAARRAKDYTRMGAAIDELSQKYPKSPQRLEALANAAGQYWVLGDNQRSLPLYEACAASFAGTPEGRECEWKVAIESFILRRPDATAKLLQHLRANPSGEHASAALYFLGRGAEAKQDRTVARAYFDRAIATFPNHFYAELCRERIRDGKLASVKPDVEVDTALRGIAFPPLAPTLQFEANAANRRRLARADFLARGAFYDFAELELRHNARQDSQSHVLALAAARMAVRRGAPDQAIRYIKSIYPGYLNLPIDQNTLPLLKLAYPLPYKDALLTEAAKNKVDPFLIAGLIRQESEFSAKVVSRSNAHGLTQIMPATGRELARRLNIRNFSTGMLFNPAVNLKLGTYYFSRLKDSLSGSIEQALASYNAGKGRVTEWLARGEYQDPAEFIESIPFNETRNYVQAVIRNSAIYRRLYS